MAMDEARYEDPLSPRAQRLTRLATYSSVTVACLLVAAKFAAWIATDSVSMLSSLMDSALDGAASMVTLVAVHMSLKPPDAEHRFGHGKAQPLAALAQSAFIAGSGLFLMLQAVERLINPQAIANTGIGIAVILFSIIVTMVLVAWQRHVARRTGSVAIKADMAHYAGDLFANMGVIAGMGLAGFAGIGWADPVFAGAVALYLIFGAWHIARDSLDLLMDREMTTEEREAIRTIALSYPQVRGVHALKTRRSGTFAFIQLDLEMNGGMTLTRAHAVGNAVSAQIRLVFPDADVIIHHDPGRDDNAGEDDELAG